MAHICDVIILYPFIVINDVLSARTLHVEVASLLFQFPVPFTWSIKRIENIFLGQKSENQAC